MKLEDKEVGVCIIPSSELDGNKMGVYVPKLMCKLPSDKIYTKETTIDFSIIKNKEDKSRKKIIECNYIISNPYLQNNISSPLFSKGENCFISFLYSDIKQPFFLSEGVEFSGRDYDIKSISASDGMTGSYGLTLDTQNGLIELSTDTNNFGTYKNTIKIDQSSDTIIIDGVNCDILGNLKINNKTLEELIDERVNEKIKEIMTNEFNDYIKDLVNDILNEKDGDN